jgi:hypothetical protein
MQAKDIPERPVLEFLATLTRPGTWCGSEDDMPENTVLRAMPPNTPPKVALAKMRALIRRGLVAGCRCGCRGDFELTAPVRAALQE